MPIYTPISAGRDFCLHCLRTQSLASKDLGRAGRELTGLRVACVFKGGATIRCEQCNKRRDICEPTTPIMLGDAADLM
ncbi:hypothetical protein ANO14919_045660 [Xylariales sp. No.14919]|nr:hypothetical protein ANO14919_045660 [Xylariales sp. No.14919]